MEHEQNAEQQIRSEEAAKPEAYAQPRKFLHVQVAGNPTEDQLETTLKQFHETWQQGGSIATADNVTASIIEINEELSGTILVPTMTAEHIAYVAHNINRAYCEAIGDPVPPHWEDADQSIKESAVRGVLFALRYNATPEMQHDAWMQTRIEQGWKYGPVKDEEKKEHPNLVPYSELPQAARVKDYLFQATVNALRWKLAVPKTDDTIEVGRVVKGAEGEPDTLEPVNILALNVGEIFVHKEKRYVTTSQPYINYAPAIPVWQVDVNEIQSQETATEQSNDQSTGTATEEAQPSA